MIRAREIARTASKRQPEAVSKLALSRTAREREVSEAKARPQLGGSKLNRTDFLADEGNGAVHHEPRAADGSGSWRLAAGRWIASRSRCTDGGNHVWTKRLELAKSRAAGARTYRRRVNAATASSSRGSARPAGGGEVNRHTASRPTGLGAAGTLAGTEARLDLPASAIAFASAALRSSWILPS